MTSVPAIGRYTVAPIWARPRARSVMRSQLLLGEPVLIISNEGGYCQVRYDSEREEGFVAEDQLLPVAAPLYEAQFHKPAFALELFAPMMSDAFGMPVTFGARLPAYDGLQLHHDGRRFLYSGQAVLPDNLIQDPALLLRMGRKWLFVPELPGGRTPTGVGAGELMQLLLSLLNVALPGAVGPMSRVGTPVDFVEQCQSGDLAFFDNGRGGISHVGLLLPGSQVLHVHGRVRVDAIDHFGIFSLDNRRYTHRLRIVKRLLPDAAVCDPIRIDERFVETPADSRQILIF